MHRDALRNVSRAEQLAAAVVAGVEPAIRKARRTLVRLAEEASPETLAALLNSYAERSVSWEDRRSVRQQVEYLVDDLDDAVGAAWALARLDRFLMTRRWRLALVNLQAARRSAANFLEHFGGRLNAYESTSLEYYLARADRALEACRSWRRVRRG
jgi:hypothetical protein